MFIRKEIANNSKIFKNDSSIFIEDVVYDSTKLLGKMANLIIIDEMDEMIEIFFVDKGSIIIGYEINKQKKYCIKYTDKCVIGAFGVTFN